MKQVRLLLLNFSYCFINRLGYYYNNRSIIKLKLSLGLLLLLSKGYHANAQIDLKHGTCYKTGPRYRRAFDLFVADRVSSEDIGNHTLALNFGYQKKWISSGLTTQYHFQSHTADIGPYFRFFPFEWRRQFKYFVSVNYQLGIGGHASDEVNLSTGLVLFHQRPFCIEIGGCYTYTFTGEGGHAFSPTVGVHYLIRSKHRVNKKD